VAEDAIAVGGVARSAQNSIRRRRGPLPKLTLFADECTLPTGGLFTAK